MRETLPLIELLSAEPCAAQARVVRYADDLRRRLKPVCNDWSDGEFEVLVELIARTKVRWEDAGRAD